MKLFIPGKLYGLGNKIISLLFFLLVSCIYAQSEPQVEDTVVVENLNDDLLVFNKEKSRYVSFNKNIHNENNVSFFVDDDAYLDSSFFLKIESTDPFCVFFNNQLFRIADTLLYFSFSSSPFQSDNLPHFVNLYSKERTCQYNIKIVRILKSHFGDKQKDKNVIVKSNTSNIYQNFSKVFTIGFITILLLFVLFKRNFPDSFKINFSFKQLLYINNNDKRQGIINANNLILVIILIVILGYLSFIFQENLLMKSKKFTSEKEYLSFFIDRSISNIIFIFLILTGKYLIHKFFGNAFRISNFTELSFNEFISKITALATWFFMISIFFIPFFENFDNIYFKYVIYIFIFLFILALINIDILSYSKFKFHKFLLFLYICTADLFPLVVAFKIIIK